MKVAIIDADLIGIKNHRFPNLASMKLSAYYKSKNEYVQLITDYKDLYHDENIWIQYQIAIKKYVKAFKKGKVPQKINDELHEKMSVCFTQSSFKFDKIIISKVFTDTEIDADFLNLDFVEYGGTGFFYDKAPPLPPEIEHIMPDYHLYDEWVQTKINNGIKRKNLTYYLDYSIGFMVRGCIRQCSFCVNKNYQKANLHSPLKEFLDESRPYICLLDDNVLACKDWKNVFDDLQSCGKAFQFKQGMDERLLTDEKCDVIFKSKWIGRYIFAFDNIKDRIIIEKKLKIIRKHTDTVPKFYLFCSYNHDCPDNYTEDFWKKDIEDLFERIKILSEYDCLPYIMRYKDYELSPYRGTYINIAAWCNQLNIFTKKSYREFCISSQERTKTGKCATMRYCQEFEIDYPEIASKYYDMKYEKE